jgi:hypothetical protein
VSKTYKVTIEWEDHEDGWRVMHSEQASLTTPISEAIGRVLCGALEGIRAPRPMLTLAHSVWELETSEGIVEGVAAAMLDLRNAADGLITAWESLDEGRDNG